SHLPPHHTLALHDALPIFLDSRIGRQRRCFTGSPCEHGGAFRRRSAIGAGAELNSGRFGSLRSLRIGDPLTRGGELHDHLELAAAVRLSFSEGWAASAGVSRFGVGLRIRSAGVDRKSTRLNSSHVSISYAVFCLKKKMYPQD